ncbi:MAG: PEP-CTERM sorting domain-containing protein [Verrucomicrobiales bacterium]|jgi:hypothetical protein|nr:PEP-CTERM sorting domain-containing protein [Verrucomicrobiales bacterium]
MFTHRLFTLAACAFGLSLVTSQGAIVWNESTDGDLSDNPAAPTTLTLITGENSIVGSISGPIVSNVSGYDEASFTVPQNTQVFSVTLESYGPDTTNMSLFNLYEGAVGADLGNLLASATLEVAHVGLNLVEAPTALMPLAEPLGPGVYTIDIREGGAAQDYEISVHVIPEPSVPLLVILGSFLLVTRRRRDS